MFKTKTAVGTAPSDILQHDAITLSSDLVKQWKLPSAQTVTLQMGSFKKLMRVIPANKKSGLKINESLAEMLGLYLTSTSNTFIRLKYNPDTSVISAGPLIGVLLSSYETDLPAKPFGAMTQFCKEAAEAARIQGAHIYFFTPKQISGNQSYVTGWTYGRTWQQQPMPLPDVIYNRLNTRKLENLPAVKQFFRHLNEQQTAIFNEKFLDKTEVFNTLSTNMLVDKYLPESRVFKGYSSLKTMTLKHNTLFIKPVRGSLGKGIIRISQEQSNFRAEHATVNGSKKQQFPNLQKLYSHLFSKRKTSSYQIQQGLQLIEIQRRPVDFRALVQKNRLGDWSVTSVVARIAGNQHFVSNLARGGTLCKVEEAISRSNMIGRVNGLDIANRLKKAALLIAQGIDDGIEAHFGELGIDFAVDRYGRVWLLEVNSKPSKNDNTPMQEGKIRPSVKKMISYSRYLTQF